MKIRKLVLKCAGILCAVFVLPALFNAASVYAEVREVYDVDSLKKAFASTGGGEAKMTDNITLTGNTAVRSELILDLNGHTLNMSNKTLLAYNNLTVIDSSVDKSGKIASTASWVLQIGGSGIIGSFTLKSGTMEGSNYNIRILADNKLVIDGGIVKGNSFVIYDEGEFIMNGGEVNASSGVAVRINQNSTFTMNDGLMKTGGDSCAVLLGAAGANFTMNGGKIEATYVNAEGTSGGNAVCAFKDTETTINDGELVAVGNAITGNGSGPESGSSDGSNAIFNINGGSITSSIGAGIYAPQLNGQTTITGGTIKGRTGIEIRAGELNISGGTIISEGDYEVAAETNGLTTFGAAISAAQHTSKQEITINVTGGNYTANTPISDANPLGYGEVEHSKVHINVSGGKFIGENNDGVYDNIVNGYKKYDKSGFFIVVPEDYEEDEDILVPDTGDTTSEKSGAGFDAFTQIATISTLLLLCLCPVTHRAYQVAHRKSQF